MINLEEQIKEVTTVQYTIPGVPYTYSTKERALDALKYQVKELKAKKKVLAITTFLEDLFNSDKVDYRLTDNPYNNKIKLGQFLLKNHKDITDLINLLNEIEDGH